MNRNLEILKKFIGEQNQRIQNDISKQGYKDDSPYKNNPFNIIQGTPQGTPITMKGVSTPLIGMDEFGNKQKMYPGQEYYYPGSQVKEIPVAQMGGTGIMYADRDYQVGGYTRPVVENTQVGTARDRRGMALEIKDYHDALKDEHELRTTGQIKNPSSTTYKQKAPQIAEIRKYIPQSTASKAWEVATHPTTALGYAARHEDLPDNFSRGDINAHEQAVNIINPFFYADEAGHFLKNVATGHPLDAADNVLNIAPVAAEFGPEINQGINYAINKKFLPFGERILPKELSVKYIEPRAKIEGVNDLYGENTLGEVVLQDKKGHNYGYLTMTKGADNSAKVGAIEVDEALRGHRAQDALYQKAIKQLQEKGYPGIESGQKLQMPEITSKTHERFNYIDSGKRGDTPVTIKTLISHKNPNIIPEWESNYKNIAKPRENISLKEAYQKSKKYISKSVEDLFSKDQLTTIPTAIGVGTASQIPQKKQGGSIINKQKKALSWINS